MVRRLESFIRVRVPLQRKQYAWGTSDTQRDSVCMRERERDGVAVCVCVRGPEREKERERAYLWAG